MGLKSQGPGVGVAKRIKQVPDFPGIAYILHKIPLEHDFLRLGVCYSVRLEFCLGNRTFRLV